MVSHFREKRHRWAIDRGDGELLGTGGDHQITPLGTLLYHRKDDARAIWKAWRDVFQNSRVVKVRVKYEVE